MQLLTQELRKQIPPLYSGENAPEGTSPPVHAKFFAPWSNWTWYVTEANAIVPVEYGLHEYGDREVPLDAPEAENPTDVRFFGLVDGHECELGYFSLRELESVRGPGGMTIERDIHWVPRTLAEVQAAKAAKDYAKL